MESKNLFFKGLIIGVLVTTPIWIVGIIIYNLIF
ncbi:hypothetical protein JOC74_000585 [Bacillus capparidis]|uniref:Uncharacterized protein n=1 Tax=Bacillus capparidis TaxID=1840411 RepID=A0ABS4CTI8_9BACI|nr:hypothetical protein [Bacillus capparidis]